MRKDSRRPLVLAHVLAQLDAVGDAGTYEEIGAATGMSSVGAWKHVRTLVAEGKLTKKKGKIGPGERPADLSSLGTGQLRDELARRGATFDALEEPRPMRGRPCAADGCSMLVQRGKLMCRRHWFRLPPPMRSAIMSAWGARDMQAYADAVEAARQELGGFTRVVERVE